MIISDRQDYRRFSLSFLPFFLQNMGLFFCVGLFFFFAIRKRIFLTLCSSLVGSTNTALVCISNLQVLEWLEGKEYHRRVSFTRKPFTLFMEVNSQYVHPMNVKEGSVHRGQTQWLWSPGSSLSLLQTYLSFLLC